MIAHPDPAYSDVYRGLCSANRLFICNMYEQTAGNSQPATRSPLKPSRPKSPTHNKPTYVQSQIHIIRRIYKAPNYRSSNEAEQGTLTGKHKR